VAKPTRFTQEMMDRYFTKGYWNKMRPSDYWERNSIRYPEKEAFVDQHKRVTWAQAKKYADRLALGLLELGFKKDDVILMQLPNCVESYLVRCACEEAGVLCATIQMNPREAEILSLAKRTKATGVVIQHKNRGRDYFATMANVQREVASMRIFVTGEDVPAGAHSIEQMMERPIENEYPPNRLDETRFDVTEVAVLGTTSGTTGEPKIVEHTIAARAAMGDFYGRIVGGLTDEDIIGVIGSCIMGGAAALSYSGGAAAVGAKTVLLETWDAEEAFKLIEKERTSVIFAVPTQLIMMLKHPNIDRYNFSSLRAIFHATSTLPYEAAEGLERKVQAKLISSYGTFDGGVITAQTMDDPPEIRWGTVGRCAFGNELKLVREDGKEAAQGEMGEVVFRGACTCSGFYKDMDATLQTWGELGEGGWFKTGDLAVLDEHQYVSLVGRMKEVIIRGGQNVYPQNIESMLITHPKVAQVAIIGMPDPVMGERVCAYIATKPGQQFSFEEMISFLKEHEVASYNLPERLEIRSELPTGDLGKVMKPRLKEDLLSKMQAEGKK